MSRHQAKAAGKNFVTDLHFGIFLSKLSHGSEEDFIEQLATSSQFDSKRKWRRNFAKYAIL
jgi:hypothetical protein